MTKLKGAIGWLPALAGFATWILADFYPEAQIHFVVLGLITSIVISVIIHELAHFIAARFLGLKPWWLDIGHGAIVFEKQFRKIRLTLKEFPYSGLVSPFILESEQNRARWKMSIMVATGPVSNAMLLATFWTYTPRLSAVDISNWQLFSWEMCIANAYLLLISLLPFRSSMDGVKLPNDGLHLILLLISQLLQNWAKRLREAYPVGPCEGPSWYWAEIRLRQKHY